MRRRMENARLVWNLPLPSDVISTLDQGCEHQIPIIRSHLGLLLEVICFFKIYQVGRKFWRTSLVSTDRIVIELFPSL